MSAARNPFDAIHHIQLAIPAEGEERARSFYVDLLGMTEIPKPNELRARGGLWLESGGVKLHLGADHDFHAAMKAHPALRCVDYDVLLDRLRKSGVSVVNDGRPVDGKRHAYISDPFGNRIELIE